MNRHLKEQQSKRECNHFANFGELLWLYAKYVENISNRAIRLKYSSSGFFPVFLFPRCLFYWLFRHCSALYVN